jgi:hypothetical protein
MRRFQFASQKALERRDAPPTSGGARRFPRRGSTYAAVLGLSLVVMAMGAGALQAVRALARASQATTDAASARQFCLSAVEWVRGRISADRQWRTNLGYGKWADRKPIGNGSINPGRTGTFTVDVAADNSGGSTNPPIVVVATGAYGKSVQKLSVRLNPTITPYSCLEPAVCVKGTAQFTNSSVYPNDELITSDGNMLGDITWSSRIRPDVESASGIFWGRFDGEATSGTNIREFPPDTVFDPYIAEGTAVSINALPVSGIHRELKRVVLSPQSNPLTGSTNAKGVYVIDCQGQPVAIRESRIVGTLVLLNTGGVLIDGSVHLAAAVSNYPCLLAAGDLSLATSSASLQEGSPNSTNFNPASTPYPFPSGTTDSDTNDSYPSGLFGLVCVTGNASILNSPSVTNLIVLKDLQSLNATLTVSANPLYLSSPPPGFFIEDMTPELGSWKQVVD